MKPLVTPSEQIPALESTGAGSRPGVSGGESRIHEVRWAEQPVDTNDAQYNRCRADTHSNAGMRVGRDVLSLTHINITPGAAGRDLRICCRGIPGTLVDRPRVLLRFCPSRADFLPDNRRM
jgi:hypothetical protein